MTAPEYDGRVPAPIPHGSRRDIDEAAPTRRHTERQPGESYPDALSRVAGERDAARHDLARLQASGPSPSMSYLNEAAEYWRTRAERLESALRLVNKAAIAAQNSDPVPPEPPVGSRLVSGDRVSWTRREDGWHCALDKACRNCPCEWDEAWDRRGWISAEIALPGPAGEKPR